MSLIGKHNSYTCDTCRKSIITIDRDDGTTPFMLGCRATAGCKGMMQSAFYTGPLINAGAQATFEWRKATYKEYVRASREMKQHFDMGGLDIHPIKL